MGRLRRRMVSASSFWPQAFTGNMSVTSSATPVAMACTIVEIQALASPSSMNVKKLQPLVEQLLDDVAHGVAGILVVQRLKGGRHHLLLPLGT